MSGEGAQTFALLYKPQLEMSEDYGHKTLPPTVETMNVKQTRAY